MEKLFYKVMNCEFYIYIDYSNTNIKHLKLEGDSSSIKKEKETLDLLHKNSGLISEKFIIKYKPGLSKEIFLFFENDNKIISLREYILNKINLEGLYEERAINTIICEILITMQFCHDNSIILNNINVDNILIKRDLSIVLFDFTQVQDIRNAPIKYKRRCLINDYSNFFNIVFNLIYTKDFSLKGLKNMNIKKYLTILEENEQKIIYEQHKDFLENLFNMIIGKNEKVEKSLYRFGEKYIWIKETYSKIVINYYIEEEKVEKKEKEKVNEKEEEKLDEKEEEKFKVKMMLIKETFEDCLEEKRKDLNLFHFS